MATYLVHDGFQTNMKGIDFSVLFNGTPTVESKSRYVLDFGDGTVDFRGEGFKYNNDGVPTGGTVEGYAINVGGSQALSFGGFEVSVKAFVKAASSVSTTDDQRLLASMLENNDRVIGANMADGLAGYAGNDKLIGAGGADFLWGGAGKDKFIFLAASDSTAAEMDTIMDFAKGDKIALGAITDFDFIGTGVYTGGSAQVGYTQSGGDTFVNADVDGDTVTDLTIKIEGTHTLVASDFI